MTPLSGVGLDHHGPGLTTGVSPHWCLHMWEVQHSAGLMLTLTSAFLLFLATFLSGI